MEMAELRALLTPDGLRLLDSMPPVTTSADVAREVTRLRAAGHSPDLVSAVVGQARLRTRAESKFGPLAARMLFTRAGLEQSTRLPVAALHAGRFRDAGLGSVADLGSGIGGDALGFAGIGMDVLAVDADEVTAAIAACNLAPFGSSAEVRRAQAEDVDVSGSAGVWLDPARRTAGHTETSRLSRPEDYSPSLDWAFTLATQKPTGIKLGPGFDRDRLPSFAEAQWITADGSTLELVLWSGELARPGITRAAVVMTDGQSHELTAPADSEDEPVHPLGTFIHEPAGSVIRARLVGDVARALEAGPIAPGIAYLTGDAAVTSPFVSTFRVREQLPADVKKLGRALRERGIGRLEIKKRGVDVDPAVLRTKLGLKGDASATLLLTRVGSTRIAVLADRI
ncbi:THUMP-like domain-containing protein [Microbacterium lacus]|uniref:THUMP-like domain-containing protein n=1 Tax=Microbacterium lacus TaxID=415217 RepID=UPI000C2BED71|nr:SAM-dependent methyltransferase [Microbacterium lacus]